MKLGVVIPAYKEDQNIVKLIRALLGLSLDIEILVVDDSPDDCTVRAVESIQSPWVALIHRSKKGGRGSAVIEGIQKLLSASCEVICEMDADFSHDPSELLHLVEVLRTKNLDMLIASRYLPSSEICNWPLSRRIFSKSANILARFLLSVPVQDYTNGYRLYNRQAAALVADHCGRLGSGFIALSEILVHLYYKGFKIGEEPTVFVNRMRGESSLNRKEITNACMGLIKIYQLKRQLKNLR